MAEVIGTVGTLDTRFYTARELARRSCRLSGDGLPLVSEAEIRAMTRRKENPLPCIKSGRKRPIVRISESVFLAYLAYEQGSCQYAEVDDAARQCVMGARP